MIINFNNKEISPEFANFLEHYQDFLKHYNHCSEIYVEYKCTNTKNINSHRLFEEAMQAHIRATDAYRKTIEAHRELTQKVITELMREN